jgi:hypothetical protein
MAYISRSDTLGRGSDEVICPDGHGHPLKGVVRDVRGDAAVPDLRASIANLGEKLDDLNSKLSRALAEIRS